MVGDTVVHQNVGLAPGTYGGIHSLQFADRILVFIIERADLIPQHCDAEEKCRHSVTKILTGFSPKLLCSSLFYFGGYILTLCS